MIALPNHVQSLVYTTSAARTLAKNKMEYDYINPKKRLGMTKTTSSSNVLEKKRMVTKKSTAYMKECTDTV